MLNTKRVKRWTAYVFSPRQFDERGYNFCLRILHQNLVGELYCSSEWFLFIYCLFTDAVSSSDYNVE
jgi:hypothetical protein